MGMHPRWIKAGSIISQTQRTIDRQFLFKPDRVTRDIIGASAARAQRKHPIRLYWLDFNINHEQAGIAPIDGSLKSITNVVLFKQTFHRIAVEEINRHLGREGGMFSSPSRDVECLDNESAQRQFGYALTNPVKDGLVERVEHWKGFSSYEYLAKGKDPVFTYIDRTAWHRAGGVKSGKPLGVFTETIRLVFTPLPGMEHLSEGQRQAQTRRQCRELEQQFREERAREGKTVMGAARMAKVGHRDRPKTTPPKTPKPLCHASSLGARKAYKAAFCAFLDAYYNASAQYRAGNWEAEFPKGSFRPPLIVAAA